MAIALQTDLDVELQQVKTTIETFLTDSNPQVQKMMRHLGATDGKMLRALFVIIGSKFDSEAKHVVEQASAVELLHLATLVHDDIVDDASLRRGNPTLHSQYGINVGLFSGDYLFSLAFIQFSKYSSSDTLLKISKTIRALCVGEIQQFMTVGKVDNTISQYLRRIYGKCASLFALSLSMGINSTDASHTVVKHHLFSAGFHMGMAFQLIDDLLDFSSTTSTLGKPAGNDLRQGIFTYPVLFELSNGNETLKKALLEEDIITAIGIVKESDGLLEGKLLAQRFTEKALYHVDQLPEQNEKELLKEIIEKMLGRKY